MICCEMKPYVQGGMVLGMLLLLVGCSTPSPKDGDLFCRSIDGMRKYLEAGGDPNLQVTISRAETSEGERIQSLLHCAVSSGDISLVKLLLAKGMDVNGRSLGGMTPLHDAPSLAMAEFLISQGGDVNAKANSGSTPLFWAQSYEIAKLLIDRGANIKVSDQQGRTALHGFAGGQTIDDKYKQTKLQISQTLIRQGADVNAADIQGNTPLHEVSDRDIAELLVAHGANLNARNKKLKIPIHTVAFRNCRNSGALDVLLRKGSDVNAQDDTGKTPLHISIEHGGGAYCKDRIFTLLKYGANVDLKDKSGSSPLSEAIQNYERLIEPYKEIKGLPESYQKAIQEEEAIINALKEQQHRLNK
jgi:ankyrin repeat protein